MEPGTQSQAARRTAGQAGLTARCTTLPSPNLRTLRGCILYLGTAEKDEIGLSRAVGHHSCSFALPQTKPLV